MSAGREPSSSSEPSGVDLDSVSASDGDSKYDFEMKSRAAKRSRLDAAAVALGLEHHASAPAATAIASIDHAEEAEARLLQLEVAELLAEVRPDHAAEGPLVELLGRLAETLAALPEADIDPSPVTGLLGDLRFMSKKPFRFRPPARVQVVGSFAVCATCAPGPTVDLALQLPPDSLDPKDQLNHRWHAKRALYLAHLAPILKRVPGITIVGWESFAADPRRPALVLTPDPRLTPGGFRVRLLPVPPEGAFPPQRLAPARNNLRTAAGTAAADGGKLALLPTPHYNASVLQDMALLRHAETLKAAAANAQALSEAAVLLRAWAHQQQLAAGADAMPGFLLTMLLVHLIESGQASAGMGPMHLFRAALVALASPKTFSSGLFMRWVQQGEPGDNASPPDAKAWRKAHEVVFVDSSGWLNLAAGVSKAALAQAAAVAGRSLALLNTGTPEAFTSVFLVGQSLASLWDYWYHVTLPEQQQGGEQQQQQQQALDGDQPSWRAVEARVEALAERALGSRARLVRVLRRAPAGKVCPRHGAPTPERPHVLLAVQADAAAALRAVDMGPPADQAANAREFREFWGERSELRRFQDGSICEAVLWDEGPSERHAIPDLAVAHVLQRHLPQGTAVACHARALDAALLRRHSSPDADVRAARYAESATERLCKQLRGLSGAALRVVATQPLGAVSRGAATFPPLPQRLAGAPQDALASDHVARCLEPIEVLCQLEGSGRWPENLEAFAKTKAALGCQLAMLLQQGYGLDAQATEEHVDVLSDGFAFRLRLATERDAAMAAKALAARQATEGPAARLTPADDMALRLWHQGAVGGVAAAAPAFGPTVRLAKRWVGAHLLSPHLCEEAVELLVVAVFAGEGVAARATTMLSEGGASQRDAAAAAAAAPASRLSGFLRFLRLLADHPWRVQPLLVDPQAELSQAQRDALVRAHAAAREAGAAPAMALCTPSGASGGAWTQGRPAAQLLHRLAVLAARSAARLERLLLPAAAAAGGSSEAAAAAAVAAVFSRDEREYDAIIRLRRDALPHADRDLQLPGARPKGTGKRNAGAVEPEDGGCSLSLAALAEQLSAEAEAAATKHSRAVLKGIPHSILDARGPRAVRRELLISFDPLPLYLSQLEARLPDLAVFCADYVGGALVGVKWRPAARALASQLAGSKAAAEATDAPGTASKKVSKRRRTSLANGSSSGTAAAAAGGGGPLLEVLADMVHLGSGLVESVELQRPLEG